jgi:sulfite reductase beta subunit-like hemoprotein
MLSGTLLSKPEGFNPTSPDTVPVPRAQDGITLVGSADGALDDRERIRADLVAKVEAKLRRRGLERERIRLHVRGDDQGRLQAGDIRIVARIAGDHAILLAGDAGGARPDRLVADRVRSDDIPRVLDCLFHAFAEERRRYEKFGDWCDRQADTYLKGLVLPTVTAAAS